MKKENRRLSAKSRAKLEEGMAHTEKALAIYRELLAADDEDKAQSVLRGWLVADARL